MLSKYTGVFVFVGVLAYVLSVPSARRHLATPGPWLASLLALLVFSPALAWNLQHGDVGLSFQTRRLPDGLSLHPLWLLEFLGGQALYLFPLLFVPFVLALWRALRAGRGEPRGWLIGADRGRPDRALQSSSACSPTACRTGRCPAGCSPFRCSGAMRRCSPRRGRASPGATWRGRRGWSPSILAALVWQTLRGGLIPASAGPRADVTLDLLDWRELKPALAARGLLGPDAVVAAPIWTVAGKVSYALGPDIPVVCACGNPQQFRYRYDQTRWNGRDMPVIVPEGRGSARLWQSAADFFDRLDPLPPVEIRRAGKTAIVLEVRMGRNLHMPAK